MNPRDKILHAIAANQPELVALPTIDFNSVISYEDNFTQFKNVLESIGGKVELIQDISILKDGFDDDRANGKLIINTLDDLDKQIVLLTSFELEKLEKVCIKGNNRLTI